MKENREQSLTLAPYLALSRPLGADHPGVAGRPVSRPALWQSAGSSAPPAGSTHVAAVDRSGS